MRALAALGVWLALAIVSAPLPAPAEEWGGIEPGVTTLDENRNAKKPAVIITVKDGEFRYVETISP